MPKRIYKRKKETIKIGDKFNKLTAIKFSYRNKRRQQYWLFRCDCGNEKIISVDSVKRGLTKACGKHGVWNTSTYHSWIAMKNRCLNKSHIAYKYYGGRGITVCEEWKNSFENFYRDMRERPKGLTLDRIDNNGNYCKDNCKWATSKEQSRNRRSNHFLTYDGKTMIVVDWANKIGIRKETLQARIRIGWSIEKALNFSYQKTPNGIKALELDNLLKQL